MFPVAAAVEKDGTYLDWEGRARPFGAVLRTSGAQTDARVLDTLAEEMDRPLGRPTNEAARAEITALGRASTRPAPPAAPPSRSSRRSGRAVGRAVVEAGAFAYRQPDLDRLTAGLVGTLRPHGACANTFNPKYVSGGSSSGSAVAVAAGLASFSLGTDTAGSGRVPAAFNNLVGLKPTCGLLSARGVVSACRSLDCISIFALTGEDAAQVLGVAARFDSGDAYSRHQPRSADSLPASLEGCRLGVPRAGQLEFFGNAGAARVFAQAVAKLEERGATRVEIDLAPFLDAARLLY